MTRIEKPQTAVPSTEDTKAVETVVESEKGATLRVERIILSETVQHSLTTHAKSIGASNIPAPNTTK